MNKVLSNKKILGIIITVIAAIFAVVSLVFIIKSYEFYSDEWGTDISINSDWLVALMISCTMLFAGIYLIYTYNKAYNSNVVMGCSFISTLLLGLYPLGRFFRALAKGKTYVESQGYLYLGVVGVILLALVIYQYIKTKKALD